MPATLLRDQGSGSASPPHPQDLWMRCGHAAGGELGLRSPGTQWGFREQLVWWFCKERLLTVAKRQMPW